MVKDARINLRVTKLSKQLVDDSEYSHTEVYMMGLNQINGSSDFDETSINTQIKLYKELIKEDEKEISILKDTNAELQKQLQRQFEKQLEIRKEKRNEKIKKIYELESKKQKTHKTIKKLKKEKQNNIKKAVDEIIPIVKRNYTQRENGKFLNRINESTLTDLAAKHGVNPKEMVKLIPSEYLNCIENIHKYTELSNIKIKNKEKEIKINYRINMLPTNIKTKQ